MKAGEGDVRSQRRFCSRWPGGFTLVELLVVIAVIAILAALILPSLSGAKQRALAINCLSNARQLQIAWQNYATDNQDKIVWNGQIGWASGYSGPPSDYISWLNSSNNNYPCGILGTAIDQMVTKGLLWPYANTLGVYRCPAQNWVPLWQAPDPANSFYRDLVVSNVLPVVSFSISGRMNGQHSLPGFGDAPMTRPFTRVASIIDPSPSQAFVFMDENAWTILGFGQFYVSDVINGSLWNIDPAISAQMSPDLPAWRHGGSATVSFADGHEELHKWLEPSTAALSVPGPVKFSTLIQTTILPGPNGGPNRDIGWLQQRYWPSTGPPRGTGP